MKYVGWTIGISLVAGAAYVGVLLLFFSDTVTDTYGTLNDARADQLFDRGWLPDILPESSRNIRTTNNLDINTSWGEFSFAPEDYAQFAGKTKPYTPQSETLNEKAREKEAAGYSVRTYTEGSTWIFFCREAAGTCEYLL